MQLTVKYTDVYDGEECRHTETFDVPEPRDDLDEWAEENIRPRCGTSNFEHDEAGYFAEIVACPERPDLVKHEFVWGDT